ARRAANSSGGKISAPVKTGCAPGDAHSSASVQTTGRSLARTALLRRCRHDAANLDHGAGGRLRLRLELDRHTILAARQRLRQRIFAIELLGWMVLERLACDLLAVDENIERAAASLAAAIRAHECDRPIGDDRHIVAEPPAARRTRTPPL